MSGHSQGSDYGGSSGWDYGGSSGWDYGGPSGWDYGGQGAHAGGRDMTGSETRRPGRRRRNPLVSAVVFLARTILWLVLTVIALSILLLAIGAFSGAGG